MAATQIPRTAAQVGAAPAAAGVPAGGTTGQVLAKSSGSDFATAWVDAAGGGSFSTSTSHTWTAQQIFETGASGGSPLIARQTGGTPGTHEVQISHDGTDGRVASKEGKTFLGPTTNCYADTTGGMYASSSRGFIIANDPVHYAGAIEAGTDWLIKWRNSTFWYQGAFDTGVARDSVGVVRITDGDAGLGALLAKLPSLADGAAPDGVLYYSTTQSKACFKIPGGAATPLY